MTKNADVISVPTTETLLALKPRVLPPNSLTFADTDEGDLPWENDTDLAEALFGESKNAYTGEICLVEKRNRGIDISAEDSIEFFAGIEGWHYMVLFSDGSAVCTTDEGEEVFLFPSPVRSAFFKSCRGVLETLLVSNRGVKNNG